MAKYNGKVEFVSENFGASKLATQFGVTRYPAVFLNDILIARPADFGFFGKDEKPGRYTPWRNADSQARFKADLTRMVDLVLAGKSAEVSQERAGDNAAADDLPSLPKFTLTGLDGKPLSADEVAGRVVLVEFWATWCPPCRATLEWLGEVKKRYGDNVAVLALAVESPEKQVRNTASSLSKEIRWAMAAPETARAFGDIVAVPTMFVFDRTGKTAKVLYGAPPDLHQQAERALDELTKAPTGGQ